MLPLIGEVHILCCNRAPVGWLPCDGRLLAITDYNLLFQVIGTTYGGNGTTTFAVPDLRCRVVMGAGAGIGVMERPLGESGGQAEVTLTASELPPHVHGVRASTLPGSHASPAGHYLAASEQRGVGYASSADQSLHPHGLSSSGSAESATPHNNMQPYLAMDFYIAYQGSYPYA